MNPKNDPMGRAIADYHKHGKTARHGYTAEIVATGTHYDYLARITKQEKQQHL